MTLRKSSKARHQRKADTVTDANISVAQRHPFATRTGVSFVVALLALSGSLCPDCGYGTRATSKRWAKCKRCSRTRIPREAMDVSAKRLVGAKPAEFCSWVTQLLGYDATTDELVDLFPGTGIMGAVAQQTELQGVPVRDPRTTPGVIHE